MFMHIDIVPLMYIWFVFFFVSVEDLLPWVCHHWAYQQQTTPPTHVVIYEFWAQAPAKGK